MKKNILLLFVILIAASLNIFGQGRAITGQEFYSIINDAGNKRFKLSRREKRTSTIYSKGAVKEIKEETDEFDLPNNRRYLRTLTVGERIEKLELIKIENRYYQKKDNGKWTKEKQWNLPDSLSGIPVPIRSSYLVETVTLNNKTVKLYIFYAVYNEYSPAPGEEKQGYFENKVWVDDEGLVIREETQSGKPQSKEIKYTKRFEYEYNPKNLKIEAPIK